MGYVTWLLQGVVYSLDIMVLGFLAVAITAAWERNKLFGVVVAGMAIVFAEGFYRLGGFPEWGYFLDLVARKLF